MLAGEPRCYATTQGLRKLMVTLLPGEVAALYSAGHYSIVQRPVEVASECLYRLISEEFYVLKGAKWGILLRCGTGLGQVLCDAVFKAL